MSQIQACSIDELLEKFKKFLEERLKLGKPLEPKHPTISSQTTIQTYYKVVKRFLTNMMIKYSMPFDSNVAREYLSICKKRGAKPRTLMLYYSAIKNLYYCMGWSFDIEWKEIVPEGIDLYVEKPYLTKEEIAEVLKYVEEKARETGRYRDAVLIYLLVYGCRPEDIRRLRINNLSRKTIKDEESDSEYEACVIEYVPCKRGRARTIILNSKATLWMERWLAKLEEHYRQALAEARKKVDEIIFIELFSQLPLFPSYLSRRRLVKDPKPITTVRIWQIVKHHISRALGRTEEAYSKAYPYGIRRGLITELLEQGQDQYLIQRWLGWKSDMCKIYDKRPKEEIARRFIISFT
jgi:integrase